MESEASRACWRSCSARISSSVSGSGTEESIQSRSTGCQLEGDVRGLALRREVGADEAPCRARLLSSSSAYRKTRGPARLTTTRPPRLRASSPEAAGREPLDELRAVASPSKSTVTRQSSLMPGILPYAGLEAMRWLAKAALQQGIGALPHAESVNYVFQRRVSRTLPAGESVLRRKFRRALGHVRAYEEHGPRAGARRRDVLRVRRGVDLAIQLSYWALGVERQTLVDIRPELSGPSRQHHARAAAPPARRARGGRRPARARPGREADRRGRRPRGVRDRLPRATRRPRDRPRRGVDRLRDEHEHARAHPCGKTSS